MMLKLSRISSVAVVMAFSAVTGGALYAQGAQTQPGQTQPGQTQPGQAQPGQTEQSYTQDQLRAYASAALEVRQISNKYQPTMAKAETTEQKTAVQEKAQTEMIAAIQAEGLSVQEYNMINQSVAADPAVKSQVERYMQDGQQ